MTTKYLIDNEAVEETEFWERLEEEVRCEVDLHLDDMIDECYEEVKIGLMTFYPSQILKNCDPIAYSMIGDDFVDQRLEDDKYDLERGESVDVGPYTFEIIEDDEFDVVED